MLRGTQPTATFGQCGRLWTVHWLLAVAAPEGGPQSLTPEVPDVGRVTFRPHVPPVAPQSLRSSGSDSFSFVYGCQVRWGQVHTAHAHGKTM